MVAKQEDRGAAVVALPGLMCDARAFGDVPGLVPAPFYGDGASLARMAARVLAAMPERAVLVGHSMGARVALEVVRAAPGRVAGLALVSTGVHPPRAGEAEARRRLRDLGRARGMGALVDAWLPPMVAPARRDDADLMGRLRAMCLDAGLAGYEAQAEALIARPPLDGLLPRIDCPVLVACGSLDAWSPPAQAHDIAARIPGARLAVVQGAGHMLPAEDPAAFETLLAGWLTETGLQRRG